MHISAFTLAANSIAVSFSCSAPLLIEVIPAIIITTHSNGGRLQVVDIAHNGPTGHEHEEVGEHVLFLRVPEWVGKLPTVLQGRTDNDKKLIIINTPKSRAKVMLRILIL